MNKLLLCVCIAMLPLTITAMERHNSPYEALAPQDILIPGHFIQPHPPLSSNTHEFSSSPNQCRSYLKKALCLGATLGCTVLATVGLVTIYNNLSDGVTEMRDSCTQCSHQLNDAQALFSQAQTLFAALSQAAPAITQISQTLQPIIAIFQRCHPNATQVLDAGQLVCAN